ncbi:MAG: rod-binding protein [Gemmataceae bacterium]|nr:rod-binding protein [Gemmataceae bacterium]
MTGPEGISSPSAALLPLPGRADAKLPPKAAEAKVREMAKEFEATLLSMLLKEMRQSFEEGGGFFPGDSGDVQGGLFDMFMSKHLADAGGVGLAAALVRQMAQSAAPPKTGTAPDARPAAPTVRRVA